MTGNGIAWCVSPDGSPGRSWNPVVGCSPVSDGCRNCWAAAMASRGLCAAHRGLAEHGRWIPGAGPRFLPETLDVPLRRRKPTGYAVCLMGDLFHEQVRDEEIAAVFGVMATCWRSRFYVLTKRADRMERWFDWAWDWRSRGQDPTDQIISRMWGYALRLPPRHPTGLPVPTGIRDETDGVIQPWPLRNVWLGVSVENQPTADERIPHLLRCPAAVRWVSMEPLLGGVDLTGIRLGTDRDMMRERLDALRGADRREHLTLNGIWTHRRVGDPPTSDPVWTTNCGPTLDWIIVGGESGPHARPCDIGWIRSIRDQCRAAGVAYFCKQLGARPIGIPDHILHRGYQQKVPDGYYRFLTDPAGADPSEWPADLRIRLFPGDEWPEAK